MCRNNESSDADIDDIRVFNKYLVFYKPDENGNGIKGIRSDAPEEIISQFLNWYRDKNRYDTGRMRPMTQSLRNKLVIRV